MIVVKATAPPPPPPNTSLSGWASLVLGEIGLEFKFMLLLPGEAQKTPRKTQPFKAVVRFGDIYVDWLAQGQQTLDMSYIT